MTGIKIGHTDITDVGKIKLGNTDIQEVYVGSKKVWPAGSSVDDLPEVEVQLFPGKTSFGFITNSPFTVEQNGHTRTYPATPSYGVAIYGVNDASFIKITMTNNLATTTFVVRNINIMHVKLNSVGKMLSIEDMFINSGSLTTFECVADTSLVTNFSSAWSGCSSLTTFPVIDTSSGTNFWGTWSDCRALTSFPVINTSSGTNFYDAWGGCSGLTSFPAIDTSSGTEFTQAWMHCSALTSFPALNVSSGTNFRGTWSGCRALTSFPALDVSKGTVFSGTWGGCRALTSFPIVDVSKGTVFSGTWYSCTSLINFPALDFSSGKDFDQVWALCDRLVCISGTLDFRKLTTGSLTFTTCTSLIVPATIGTSVRATDNATRGIWTNPNPCGELPSIADFTGIPVSGEVPLTVVFTDTSTATPTSWSWDFGDGTPLVTTQNPTHIYTTGGIYTVTLRAANIHGSSIKVRTDYITVNAPAIVVDFTGSPVHGASPLHVVFVDHSTNSPTRWLWNFGDGSGSTIQNPRHTYNSAGNYTVKLTASNTSGPDSETKTNYITVSSSVPSLSDAVFKFISSVPTSKFSSPQKPFTVRQGSVTQSYPAGTHSLTVTINVEATIVIHNTDIHTRFSFSGSHAHTIKFISLGNITNLNSCLNASNLVTFECPASTSKVTDMNLAWAYCPELESFPSIDTSNCDTLFAAWKYCFKLKCIAGTIDTRAVSPVFYRNDMFDNCLVLTQPDKASQADLIDADGAVWTNPRPCP